MDNTERRVKLVKRQIRKRQRRQAECCICGLSVLCVLLSFFLSAVIEKKNGHMQVYVSGMYGSVLLREGAGGYVLLAVAAFTVAVIITTVYVRYRKKRQKKWRKEMRDA